MTGAEWALVALLLLVAFIGIFFWTVWSVGKHEPVLRGDEMYCERCNEPWPCQAMVEITNRRAGK